MARNAASALAQAPLAPARAARAAFDVFRGVAKPFDAKVEAARAAVAPVTAKVVQPGFEAMEFAQRFIPKRIAGIPAPAFGLPPTLPGTPESQAQITGRLAAETVIPSSTDLAIGVAAGGAGKFISGVRGASAAARATQEAATAARTAEEVGALGRIQQMARAPQGPSPTQIRSMMAGRTELPPTSFVPREVPAATGDAFQAAHHRPVGSGPGELLVPGTPAPKEVPKIEIVRAHRFRPEEDAQTVFRPAVDESPDLTPQARQAVQEGVAVGEDIQKAAEGAALGAPKKPSHWQTVQSYLTRSGETTLRKQGGAGEELADAMVRYSAEREVYAGSRKEPFFQDLLRLTPDEKGAFREYLDKGVVTPGLTPQAKAVGDRARAVLNEQGDLLEAFSRKHGVTVETPQGEAFFHKRKNFFPHEIDYDRLSTPEGRAEEVANLLATGQVKTPQEAVKVVDEILSRKTAAISPQDLTSIKAPSKNVAQELKGQRVYNLVNIVQDPVVALDNHFRRIGNTVARIEAFGKDYEKLYDLVGRIAAEGGDPEAAGAIAVNMLGFEKQNNAALRAFLREVKGFESLKLGTAFVSNAPQGIVNSWLRSGSLKSAGKGLMGLFTKEGQEFARRAGIGSAAVDEYINRSLGAATGGKAKGFFPKISGFMLEKLTPFKQSEMANRTIAANAGRAYLQDTLVPMFRRNPGDPRVLKELRLFGLDPKKVLEQGGLTDQQLLTAANVFSQRRTQFTNDALSMPILSQDPLGRLIYMFKTFSFQQSKLLKEAAEVHGKLPTAARLGVVATTVGIPVAKLRSLLSARFATEEQKGTWATEFLGGLAAVGGLGLLSDLAASSKFGKAGAIGSIMGPVAQDLGEAAVAAHDIATGEPMKAMEQVIRRVPIVGPATRNLMKGAGMFSQDTRRERKGRASR
jgi:hypothetical protein